MCVYRIEKVKPLMPLEKVAQQEPSSRLNNNDVTRNNAQVASCLKASDFDKAMSTVEAAIGGNRKPRAGRDIYAILIKKYSPTLDRTQLFEWMAAANSALIQSDNQFNAGDASESSELKCAIFFWTYTAVTVSLHLPSVPRERLITALKGKNPATQQEFVSDQQISSKIFTKLLNKITGCCSSVKSRIQAEIKAKRSPAKPIAMTPRQTLKKQKPLRILPSKDSPTKRKIAELPVEQSSDDEAAETLILDTPSKKQKSTSPTKASTRLISPTKLVFPPVASSSRTTVDPPRTSHGNTSMPQPSATLQGGENLMDVDEDGENPFNVASRDKEGKHAPDDEQPRRRFRPVYLDHKQWYGVDKRVKRLWKQSEKYKKMMVESHGRHLQSLPA
ncbi:hypothetical protein H0H81_005617 [Sphagnurus paluster]|uniref:Uncharacterized protein n=1 Tax=Sphagnurus paluster TaxID=117069 RepID=A0A9P7GM02_9AGAR|nr:hypothetical protein H0H81_005617 [Sphagnurus paluster]